ncbi:MAG: ATP-binding protein [Halobacteriota archaeon]
MVTNPLTTILLIEDSPTDIRLIQEKLTDTSSDFFRVITASTLSKALKLLSDDSVDVVIADLGLPDSQGLDTFRALHAQAPALPIIVLTISDDEALGREAVQEGAQRFLSKDALTLGEAYAGIFTSMIRYAIEQKRTESTLKTSEEQLQTLFEFSPIVQIRYDPDGSPVMINRAARAFLGITDVSAIQHLNIFTSPRVSDADKVRLRAGKPARSEQTYDFDAIERQGAFPTTQSGIRYVDFSLAPIFDADGALEAYLAQVVDITERKRAEEALQQVHEKVQSLNEELRVANEELEQRVQERTEELASMNEELQSTNEELRVSNEELRHETEQRTRAEKAARTHAQRTAILNEIIHVVNEAQDLPTLYDQALAITVDNLHFDNGVIVTETASGYLCVERAHNLSPDFVEATNRIRIDDYPPARAIYREREPVITEEAPPGSISGRLGIHGAAVGIPFYSEGIVVGHIALYAERPRSFTEEDRQLFTAVGEEFGTAVTKLRAKEQAREYAAQLKEHADHLEDLVTERTAELATSEEYFRTVFEESSIGQVRYDADGCPTDINPAALVLFGISSLADIRHVGILASKRISEENKGRLLAGHRIRYEHTYDFAAVRKSGYIPTSRSDVRYVDVFMFPLFNRTTGAIDGYIAQIADITERKEAEAERESIAKFPAENPNPVFRFALDGTVLYANTPGEMLISSASFPLDQMRENCAQAYTDGAERAVEVTDGTHTYGFTLIPVADKRYVNVYGRDITERKRVEAALQSAERLAAIGETTTMIGHDLRNPLQALQLIVDLAKKYYDDIPPEAKARFDSATAERIFSGAIKQIQYMDKIVSDLQDYARPLQLEPETVHITPFITDTLRLVTIPESITVHIGVLDSITARVDPHLMQRVLANLILNAVQAMPTGGELTVGAAARDGAVVITVQDTGEGVPENMRDALFSPLSTGKAKGTGLGLAVVKRIVDAHNGTIEFESEEGEGTKFTVTLPSH